MHLRSLHDTSYIDCSSIELLIDDAFDKCYIYNFKNMKVLFPSEGEMDNTKPVLVINARENLDLRMISKFDILKR